MPCSNIKYWCTCVFRAKKLTFAFTNAWHTDLQVYFRLQQKCLCVAFCLCLHIVKMRMKDDMSKSFLPIKRVLLVHETFKTWPGNVRFLPKKRISSEQSGMLRRSGTDNNN